MVEVLWAFEEEGAEELVGLGEVGLVVSGGCMQFYNTYEIGQHLEGDC